MTTLGTESKIEWKNGKSIKEQLYDLQQEVLRTSKKTKEIVETHRLWEKFLSSWDELWSMEEQPSKIEIRWEDGDSTILLAADKLDGHKCINIWKFNYAPGDHDHIAWESYFSTWLMYDESKGKFYISMKENGDFREIWEWKYMEDDHAKKYLKKIEGYIHKVNEEKNKKWDEETDKYASNLDAKNLDASEWSSLA